jgi:integrase
MPRKTLEPRLERREEGGVWYILYHDGRRGRRQSTGTRDDVEAEALLADFKLRQGAPVSRVRTPEQYQIAETLREYLETLRARPSAATAAFNAKALVGFWGNSTVDAITKQTVAGYTKHRRAAKVGDGTIIRELGVLRAAVGLAYEEGRLTRAPTIPAPPQPPPRDLWLEGWEAKLLIDSCAERHVRLFVIVSLFTLARPGAVYELQWRGQVDFSYRRIELNPPGRAQTTKRRPPVPMSEDLYEALVEAHREASTPFVIEYHGKAIDSIKTGLRGAARRARATALREARRHQLRSPDRRLWLEAALKFKATVAYTLRHTGATWMAQEGVALDKIAAWMGHSNKRTTELYAKHHPDHLRDAAAAIGKRLHLVQRTDR